MKKGSLIVKLVFGFMGMVYTIIGMVCLTLAANCAGDIRRIFDLPKEELALSIVGTVFGVLGAGFLIAALCVGLAGRKQKRVREELLQYGNRVTGVVTDVYVNHSIRVNGRSPLVARVTCLFPAGEITLKSKNLWNDCPATGDMVEVIYDPVDEKRYVIEFPGE